MMPESLLLPYTSVRRVNKVFGIAAQRLLSNTGPLQHLCKMLFFFLKGKLTCSWHELNLFLKSL